MNYTASEIELVVKQGITQYYEEGRLEMDGCVCFERERFKRSDKEDCTIALIAGTGGILQTGYIAVNVYVHDKPGIDGKAYCDDEQCKRVETQLNGLAEYLTKNTHFQFHNDGIIMTICEEGKHMHFVSCKLYFKDKYRRGYRPSEETSK